MVETVDHVSSKADVVIPFTLFSTSVVFLVIPGN